MGHPCSRGTTHALGGIHYHILWYRPKHNMRTCAEIQRYALSRRCYQRDPRRSSELGCSELLGHRPSRMPNRPNALLTTALQPSRLSDRRAGHAAGPGLQAAAHRPHGRWHAPRSAATGVAPCHQDAQALRWRRHRFELAPLNVRSVARGAHARVGQPSPIRAYSAASVRAVALAATAVPCSPPIVYRRLS